MCFLTLDFDLCVFTFVLDFDLPGFFTALGFDSVGGYLLSVLIVVM